MAGLSFSFILVNYRSARLIRTWLASLHQINLLADEYEIIIVNNDASETKEVQILASAPGDSPDIRVIHLPENMGFGAAVNRGSVIARGEFLFLCNPDTRFLSGDFAQLRHLFGTQPEVSIIGAQLLNEQKQPEPFSVGRHISLGLFLRNHSPWRETAPTIQGFVERVSGGALCLRKTIFEQLDGFDENFFLYFEDADLCQRALNVGRKIFYTTNIQLLHTGGASMPSREQQKAWYRHSRARYFHKHRPRWEGALLRFMEKLFNV